MQVVKPGIIGADKVLPCFGLGERDVKPKNRRHVKVRSQIE